MVRVVNAQNQAHDEVHENIDWLEVSASSEDLRATILELQDVKQRQDVVNQIIDRLDRNQSDDEAAFNCERDRLQNVRDALRAPTT
ncbi:hypothetical protein NDA16_003033 [Ustilago loliicola]|nr:hypothetical protein NDA16_003033 [Ustilago loliicola]